MSAYQYIHQLFDLNFCCSFHPHYRNNSLSDYSLYDEEKKGLPTFKVDVTQVRLTISKWKFLLLHLLDDEQNYFEQLLALLE